MKAKTIISVLLIAVLGLTACGSSSTSTSSASATSTSGMSAGQSCGSALKNLYTQYKADGKLDLQNASNLLNIASLASSVGTIKNAEKNSSYYKSFAQGMISGSMQTVTTSNVDSVISSLSGMDLSALSSKSAQASSTASSIASTASSLTSLLSSLKK
ncbi:MAG: hypothetical protein J6Y77_07525 [Paludibacteraceae bacterium]|nr:hypothetical protein [Paludibacteraceae bacterium]